MSGFYHNQSHHYNETSHRRHRPRSIYTAVGVVEDETVPEDDLPTPDSLDQGDYIHFETSIYESPPNPSFLDSILNPAGLDHNRFSPFAYRPNPDMPPSTRASQTRPARLPNGYVDLTSAPDSPPQRRKRESPSPGPSAKRQKREDGSAAKKEALEEPKIEEVDLTEEESARKILQKQREDAVKSQTKPEEKPTTFNTFNCVICMDMPTDLTATACGHLFCHTCLMEALVAGENRAGPGEQKRSQCPVCRKFINRNKATDVIPLMLKKGLASQPRKKTGPSPAAVATKV